MLVMSLTRPDLRPSSPVPLYEQIARHVTAAIASGDLRPGDKLPAWRDLADDWEVGQSTIARAMEVLRERGIVVSTHGKGTFVADPQPPGPPAE